MNANVRYVMAAESRTRSTLLVTYGVVWDSSMNFLLKPVIAKALEGEVPYF